jgi:DNA-directed RNA polymerase sigma subunit (sigma70/sigma32)
MLESYILKIFFDDTEEQTSREEINHFKIPDIYLDQLEQKNIPKIPSLKVERSFFDNKGSMWGNGVDKDKVFDSYYRLVVYYIIQYSSDQKINKGLLYDTERSLYNSVWTFDYRQGYRYFAYASWWVIKSITRNLAMEKYISQLPENIASILRLLKKEKREGNERTYGEVTLEEVEKKYHIPIKKLEEAIVHTYAMSPNDYPAYHLRINGLHRRILQDKDIPVLKLIYGLGGEKPHTRTETANILGYTRSAVNERQKLEILNLNRAL